MAFNCVLNEYKPYKWVDNKDNTTLHIYKRKTYFYAPFETIAGFQAIALKYNRKASPYTFAGEAAIKRAKQLLGLTASSQLLMPHCQFTTPVCVYKYSKIYAKAEKLF